MSIHPEYIGGAVLAVLVGSTLFFTTAQPNQTVNGKKPVHTKVHLSTFRTDETVDGDLTVKVKVKAKNAKDKDKEQGDTVKEYKLDFSWLNNQPYQSDEQKDNPDVKSEYVRYRYLIDPCLFPPDLGAWIGASNGTSGRDGSKEPLQVGLRMSVVRLLYGTTSPDFLLNQHYYGAGLSFYPPPELTNNTLAHFGIGAGRLYSFHREKPANIIYLSFTTKLP